MTAVGIVHPGAMGASLAASCTVPTLWCTAGRSEATRSRAGSAGMTAVDVLGELVERCDVIVSVCPPANAVEVAEQVAAAGFRGIYVDANAIAPDTARAIGGRFGRFVDGGIVGPPVAGPGSTRLYLSGADAGEVAELWAGSDLGTRVLDGGPGAASALKVCYATWTKVSSAMLLAVRGVARSEGVEAALVAEWAISQPGLEQRSIAIANGVAPKAWRFVGEMEEISATFEARGLPGGYAAAAAATYERLAGLGDDVDVEIDDVIDRLTG